MMYIILLYLKPVCCIIFFSFRMYRTNFYSELGNYFPLLSAIIIHRLQLCKLKKKNGTSETFQVHQIDIMYKGC